MGDVRFFGVLDETGLPLGFYPSDIWPDDSRPADCIELTPDQYAALLGNYGARLVAGEVVYLPPAPPLTPEQVLASLSAVSHAQIIAALVLAGIITEAEGVAWISGTLPDAVDAMIATLPADQRVIARLRAIRPSSVVPTDPLVAALASAQGHDTADLIALFETAAAL